MGRFLNADSYTTTGQHIIGNHMLTYCLNNPVNRSDLLGTASLWYYLIVDHDMGFIHRTVQAHIQAFGGPNIKAELVLTGLGRADIVDKSLGTVWEVKHAGVDPYGRLLEAFAQATGYVGGINDGIQIVKLGSAEMFEGKFCISCFDYNYEVNYYTPTDGVVLYTVKETNNSSESYAKSYVYNPKKEESEYYSSGFVIVPIVPMGFFAAGGPCTGSIVYNKNYLM